MPRWAKAKGVLGVVGTQACVSAEIEYLKQLIADGFVGEVLSTTIVAYGGGWGGIVPLQKGYGYTVDRANGATMLTIPVGHTLAALTDVLGEIVQLSSVLAQRRNSALCLDTGKTLPMTAHDQVLVSGILAGGVPVSIHYRGGMPRGGDGLWWEIHGTEGDIRVSGPSGHSQMVPLTLTGVRGDGKEFQALKIPASYLTGWPEDVVPGNVARLYAKMAHDLREGTHTAPNFDDAVVVHRIIDSIERVGEDVSRT